MKEARVIQEHKTTYVISDGGREYVATVRGSFFGTDKFPKVGDRVLFTQGSDDKASIEEVLPRTSEIVRKAAGSDANQVIVTNVDVIFIVMGLDGDFNLSRLERYLLLAAQSGIAPVIILNKSDTVEDAQPYVDKVTAVAPGIAVHAVSALQRNGMDALLQYFAPETVVALLGSSGAGKSTVTNWLLNDERQLTAAVRADDSRGVHTTTSKQLFALPRGGYLIDTPGMRELGVVDSSTEDEDAVFSRVEALSGQCKYSNCDHEKSDGCAVRAAFAEDPGFERQVRNYKKLQQERFVKKEKEKETTRHLKKFYKKNGRGKSSV